jgi:hypothetical protein
VHCHRNSKAGYVREALGYVDRDANAYLTDMLIVAAENMPTRAASRQPDDAAPTKKRP